MARLYANENFPFDVVQGLRALGHQVITIQETGKGGQSVPDHEVLEYGRANDMAVLTLNRRHFIRLPKQHVDHCGIIACTFDPAFDALASRIHASIENETLLRGNLIRINRPSSSV